MRKRIEGQPALGASGGIPKPIGHPCVAELMHGDTNDEGKEQTKEDFRISKLGKQALPRVGWAGRGPPDPFHRSTGIAKSQRSLLAGGAFATIERCTRAWAWVPVRPKLRRMRPFGRLNYSEKVNT